MDDASPPRAEPAFADVPDPADADPGGPAPVPARSSVVRDSRTLAVGTIASRVTGFLRTAMVVAVLGVGSVRQAFEVSNTLPNSLYELLLGGVLSSTLVPLLVQAKAAAGGPAAVQAYRRRLLVLVIGGLLALTAGAVLAAPPLIRLYSTSPDPAQIDLAVTWARFFLPQILFYGVTATVGAILNTEGRFRAPVWAPVLNNVVVVATLGLFVALPGPRTPSPISLTGGQLWVLGAGTTLGVVAMTAALLPALRATGFRWRARAAARALARLGVAPGDEATASLHGLGLRRIARLARWVIVYVLATQVAFLVLTRLATAVGQVPLYVTAFIVWQLPHAVVAVSVITALLPRLSRHSVAGRPDLLRAELDRGLRLAIVVLLPSAAALVVLGRPVAVLLFAHGATSVDQALRIGLVLGVLALGLVPFSSYQLQLRAFYAQSDTRTPALVQVLVSTVTIAVDVTAALALPDRNRVYGLAAGLVVANAVGAIATAVLLRRRLGRARPVAGRRYPIASPLLRMLVAALVAAAAMAGVADLLGPAPRSFTAALITLAGAGAAGLLTYVAALLLLRVPEAAALLSTTRDQVRTALGRSAHLP